MAAKKKFYAVAKGRTPGVYTEWFGENGAQAQVMTYPGAVYKGFPTRAEAEEFVRNPPVWNFRPKTTSGKSESGSKKAAPRKAPPGTEQVIIYTDGGCRYNPGPGGYGVIVQRGKKRKEYSSGFRRTTNNRMELLASIVGLSSLEKPSRVTLYSDSRYVVNGISKGWAEKWRKNNWMRNKEEPAVNPDLWERLLSLCEKHYVAFKWVKGHSDNEGNERCDQLATTAARKRNLEIDEVYEKGN